MSRRTIVLVAFCLWGTYSAGVAAEGPILSYDFGAAGADGTIANLAGPALSGRLRGAAKIVPLPGAEAGSALQLDGVSGCVEVPGSAGLHVGDEGFTILATVRFADSGTVETQPDSHDMILFKDREYLLGRSRERLYFNLHNGKEWAAGVTGGQCQPGVWTHVAVIVERINEPPQGRVGYYVRMFLNGEMVGGREILNYTAATTDADLDLGRGWGGPWFYHGEIAQAAVYPRAITGSELNQLLKQEKLARVTFKHTADTDPRYQPLLAQTRAAVAAVAPPRDRVLKQLLAAATQAANHADSQAAILPYLGTVQRLAQKTEANPLQVFVKAHPEFEFLDNGRVGIAFFAPRPGATALCSLFDLTSGRETFGEQRELWSLAYDPPRAGERRRLDSSATSLTATVTVNRAAHSAVLRWRHRPTQEQPFEGEVRSELRLNGSRLSLSLAVDNHNPQIALREVRFPQLRLRRLEDGADQLLVPRMSGVVQPNPVRTHLSYEGAYPSGAAHMQFFAYYDDSRGVYVACEDGKARSKTLLAGGADNDCELAALWFVGCPGAGGNGFRSSGEVAVELFEGDWFDAAQLYKRFARTADWWPASRTRQDTPDWYRNLTVWFIGNANSTAAVDALIEQRRSLGLPVGLHWYGWNTEKFDDDYPHFTAREGFADTVSRLKAEGVYAKPYINGRLWETRDRGDEDFQYTSVALPATTKDLDGKPYLEGYNNKSFSPMCPATPLWQQTMADLCGQLAGYGVPAIYLDQVSAARPRPCFDRSHPHAAGAGEAWLEQGYWTMMGRIRRETKAAHPQVAFDSEDAAEPYMHVLDGTLPWRFVDIGHVPAYQAIYAGRTQFTGRHFDDTTYEALFPKAAEQMLYGEQIGWFSVGKLTSNAAFQTFVKKLAHTRKAFLPFFNSGDMLKPGQFVEPAPTVTADWGFYGPRIITTPAVLHSVWRLDDSVAVLLTNTSCDPVTVKFIPRFEAWGLPGKARQALEYHEGQAPATISWPRQEARSVTVPGYGLTAWLLTGGNPSAARHAALATAAAELFASLKRFDDEAGMTPERKRAELDGRNPWVVPEVAVRSAAEWIPAASAPKLVRARASADGAFVGWIGDGGSLCWGPIDFGEAAGTAVMECEVSVPPTTSNGRLRVLKVSDQKGILLAEIALKSTGDYQTYTTVRLPLPPNIAGPQPLVIQATGSGGGLCNVRRWRVVREP
ncbi:MAG: DUF6259 domain-containing protein [Armatimonadia bacterium]